MTKTEQQKADTILAEMKPNRDIPLGFEIPNLDGHSVNPMNYAALERLFDLLASYCHDKRHAMQARLSGAIDTALLRERAMDRTYQSLPEWARW